MKFNCWFSFFFFCPIWHSKSGFLTLWCFTALLNKSNSKNKEKSYKKFIFCKFISLSHYIKYSYWELWSQTSSFHILSLLWSTAVKTTDGQYFTLQILLMMTKIWWHFMTHWDMEKKARYVSNIKILWAELECRLYFLFCFVSPSFHALPYPPILESRLSGKIILICIIEF